MRGSSPLPGLPRPPSGKSCAHCVPWAGLPPALASRSSLPSPCRGAGEGRGAVEPGHVLRGSPRWEAGIQDAGNWPRSPVCTEHRPRPRPRWGRPLRPRLAPRRGAPDAPARWSASLPRFLADIPSPASWSLASELPRTGGRTLVINSHPAPSGPREAQDRPRGSLSWELAAGPSSASSLLLPRERPPLVSALPPSAQSSLCEAPTLLPRGRHSLGLPEREQTGGSSHTQRCPGRPVGPCVPQAL